MAKIHLVLLISIVLLTSRANGLKCYFCTSSTSIYNEDCQNGTSTLRSGQCPFGYNFCVARYTEHTDGSSNIMRDCSVSAELPSLDTASSIGYQITCSFDLCNSGYIGASTPTTTTSIPHTFNPSSSAPRLQHAISLCTWTFGFTLYFLGGIVLLMDAFSNVF
ncbi:uncharacterized protein LOC124188838 isoform X2 [Daphnia pulex]|uniref:uncharacterized protein LOC124188838 isoform X2 n=1 Tax=Daphnia pulex TaxID=6669 RepID=UPI001EDD9E04|nr:uncharacterized protein LOC124188838 isoform X2 [Daphnia pulex]